ncbi:class I and II aminotransferase [Niastella vici]|uniref:Aminotransferase n=1 Tax=Niastella vici TaxID=1703345 RepID=A0A1V9FWA6_9BACT|nr:aminotransferase class I/II-fold pyridoxal phosphate-dependent enzyme [Niastella vici]OQP62631.1 class I and II aminotransferase [Niastella vici]
MLQGHGDDAYRYQQKMRANFSTNVWYGREPAGLQEHIFAHWPVINQYPEVQAESLARKISRHHGLQASQLLITNGTTESIYLIAQAFGKSQTTIAIPAFAEYEDACRLHHHEVHFVQQCDVQAGLQTAPGLFFICNPNNPTGHVFTQLGELITTNPQTLFVIDEAFIEFTRNVPSLLTLINTCDNLIVMRSLTKAFSIPGLRLGYLAANAQMISTLLPCKMPWSVNALAIEAGHYIFDHYANAPLPLTELFREKEQLIQQLTQLSFTIDDSHTHFFLAKMPFGTARQLKAYLIEAHGLLIRDAANFRGLTEQHIRLATLTKDNNELLTHALTEWTQHYS